MTEGTGAPPAGRAILLGYTVPSQTGRRAQLRHRLRREARRLGLKPAAEIYCPVSSGTSLSAEKRVLDLLATGQATAMVVAVADGLRGNAPAC